MKKRDLWERFWEKVDVQGPDDCWNWTAGGVGGYGRIGYQRKGLLAHRLSARLAFGMFDERLNVLHTCDNPPCVNPAHLYLGDQVDNVRDAITRGRFRNGNQAKTACSQGHPFSRENTHLLANGSRRCRTCDARRAQEYRTRKKAS
jgi:hypothetical protein